MPPIPSRPISGRYRGRHDRFDIELRVDVDGSRTTRQVSADYSHAADGRSRGSMRITEPAILATPTHIVISGTGQFTWATQHPHVEIAISHADPGRPGAAATVRHLDDRGDVGAVYECGFRSSSFRTVQLEQAVQRGVTRFSSYDTSVLPSGGPPRTLSCVSAFAEAGIELVAHEPAPVDTSEAGADAFWSDAELHAAMEAHFTSWADRPEWAIWLMHAAAHESSRFDTPQDGTLVGLMFDRHGAQRQGCAVFYNSIRGADAKNQRYQLYTCVHELAHGFNLLHSWQKSMARPPVTSRPNATSWMNYPHLVEGGAAAFWATFAFAFDDQELAHLRHAFRDDVVMGGSAFFSDAALRAPQSARSQGGEADGLQLSLSIPSAFAYGVPVSADLALRATAPEGRRVSTVLGPRSTTADVAISRPDGGLQVFEPLLHHCRGGETVLLRPGDPPIRDAVLLHYGQHGYPFREPGVYDIQARFTAADGSPALSNIVRIRVDPPRSPLESTVGALAYRDEQVGVLLSLMGSDAPALRGGNQALSEIIAQYPGHPMAAIGRLVQGTNAARAFKSIVPEGPLQVRRRQLARARALVDEVVDVVRMQRAADAVLASGGGRQALTAAMAAVGTRPGVDPSVAAFLRTRLGEFGAVLGDVASTNVASELPHPPPQPPPDEHRTTVTGNGDEDGPKPEDECKLFAKCPLPRCCRRRGRLCDILCELRRLLVGVLKLFVRILRQRPPREK